MAVHDYHDALPGFDPAQILHDGCGECEARAGFRSHGLTELDRDNFARAWRRAADWNKGRLDGGVSGAEVPMLDVLWAVQVQLERWGQPIGVLPTSGMERAS